ncbi:MAG TPA: hypothetical protein VEA69_18015 [Tepidisphaeraceae bacterium]|nr:hypothetical protein [Tepidisphaeraceae bacterium]
MSDLASTADRLRIVKKAREHFLALWALDCLYDHARVGRKLIQDIKRVSDRAPRRRKGRRDDPGRA